MNAEVHRDPFAAPHELSLASPDDFEVAWFDAPRHSSRPPARVSPSQSPPPPIDDPVADPWFR